VYNAGGRRPFHRSAARHDRIQFPWKLNAV